MCDKIKLVAAERIDETLQGLRHTNSDYDMMVKTLGETAEQIETAVDNQIKVDKNVYEKFYNLSSQVSAIEQEQIYIQGVKDGYRFLKLLQE